MTVSWLRENPAGVVVIATTWPICAVATLIVVLRFYARKLKRVGYGADDYLMVIGLVRPREYQFIYCWADGFQLRSWALTAVVVALPLVRLKSMRSVKDRMSGH